MFSRVLFLYFKTYIIIALFFFLVNKQMDYMGCLYDKYQKSPGMSRS